MTILKFYTAFILAFFTLHSFAITPEVNFAEPNEWISAFNPEQTTLEEIQGSVTYVLFETQINLLKPKKEQFFRYISRANSEQGLTSISQVEIQFSPNFENLSIHNVEIIRDGKRLNRLQHSELKVFQQENQLNNNIYSEDWTALLILKDIRVGDLIEYSYTIEGANPVFGDKYFGTSMLSWSAPIDNTYFRLVAPKDSELNFKLFKSPKEIEKKTLSHFDEYTLAQSKVGAIRVEDYSPSWFVPYAYLSYSQYRDWQDVNMWAHELYQVDAKLPKELSDIIDSLQTTNKHTSIAQSIQWMQDNIRYFGVEMGMNSHMPSNPFETFERRYGDCKDKAVLMIAVLKYLNINAHPVLVSTDSLQAVKNELASPNAFNHVIVTFELDGISYWVDATVTGQRGDLQSMTFPHFEQGLVVKSQTQGFTAIKPANEEQIRGGIFVEQELEIASKSAQSRLHIKTTYTGWQAEFTRNYIDSYGVKSSSKDHLDYIAKYYPNVEADGQLTLQDDEEKNEITIQESYLLEDFTDNFNDTDRLYVYAHQILDNLWLPEIRNRQSPFVLPYYLDIEIENRIKAEHADDLLWFDDSKVNISDNKWIFYNKSVDKNENVVTAKYKFNSLLSEVTAEGFDGYAKLLGEIEDSFTQTLLLKKEKVFVDNQTRAKNLVKDLLKKRNRKD